MPKNKITVDVCGVLLSLTTEESEAYMEQLAEKVRKEINGFVAAGVPNREIAAVAAALDFYDRLEKQQAPEKDACEALRSEVRDLKAALKKLRDDAAKADKARVKEIEALKKDLEDQEAAALSERDALREEVGKVEKELVRQEADLRREREAWQQEIARLKQKRNERESALRVEAPIAEPDAGIEKEEKKTLKNPMRPEYEQQGFVSFFEKSDS